MCWGTTIWLPTTTLKTDSCGVMSNAIKDLMCVWIQLISLKTENWKLKIENNKKIIFFYCLLLFSTLHWPKITVHGQWTVHNALDLKKKNTQNTGATTLPKRTFSVSFSSLIGFEVEWHSSRFDKWYQSQGHGFESRECHCKGGIVGRTTIWLPTTTLKIDLSVSFSSPIDFEVEWHSSRFDIMIFED